MKYDSIDYYKLSKKALQEQYKFNSTDANWILKRLWAKTARSAKANTYEAIYRSIISNSGYYITTIDREKGIFELKENPNYIKDERYDQFIKNLKIQPKLNSEIYITLRKFDGFLNAYQQYPQIDIAFKLYIQGKININQLSKVVNKFKNSREYGKAGSP